MLNKQYSDIKKETKRKGRNLIAIKLALKSLRVKDDSYTKTQVQNLRVQLFKTIKEIRLLNHSSNQTRSIENTMQEIRLFYVRYADDWVLLTNGSREVTDFLKRKITDFLKDKLKLKLSETKTLITDITKTPAKFLGFLIKGTDRGPLSKKPLRSGGPQTK